jgi:hypothetical protein
MKRILIKRHYHEILEKGKKKFIVCKSIAGILDKKDKWKIIPFESFEKKPKKPYYGFRTKKAALEFLKKKF